MSSQYTHTYNTVIDIIMWIVSGTRIQRKGSSVWIEMRKKKACELGIGEYLRNEFKLD